MQSCLQLWPSPALRAVHRGCSGGALVAVESGQSRGISVGVGSIGL